MDETLLAVRALLDDTRDDWDELLALYGSLREAAFQNKPMTRKDRARVAEYLRKPDAVQAPPRRREHG
jgi:hypothetical protein